MRQIGAITKEEGAEPTIDEVWAALFLIELGLNVKFLRANRSSGGTTPDIEIDGIKWEIKTPRKSKENTLDHAMKKGLKQSENLVFDLRKLKNTGIQANRKLKKEFDRTKKWKRLWVISKEGRLLTYAK